MGWPRVGVGVIVFKDRTASEVLLVQRGKSPARGLWAPPGGRIEAGETVAEAAAREVHEECGLHVSVPENAAITTIDVMDHAEDGTLRHHYVLIEVLAFYMEGEPRPGDDAEECRWWPVDALHEAQPQVTDLARVVELAQGVNGTLGAQLVEGARVVAERNLRRGVDDDVFPTVRNDPVLWKDAVLAAIYRCVERHNSREFKREDLVNEELERIKEETQTQGRTPQQTLSRVLQELRNEGVIEFVDHAGTYYLKK